MHVGRMIGSFVSLASTKFVASSESTLWNLSGLNLDVVVRSLENVPSSLGGLEVDMQLTWTGVALVLFGTIGYTVLFRPDVHRGLWCVTPKVHWRKLEVHRGLWRVVPAAKINKKESIFEPFLTCSPLQLERDRRRIFYANAGPWRKPFMFSSRPPVMRSKEYGPKSTTCQWDRNQEKSKRPVTNRFRLRFVQNLDIAVHGCYLLVENEESMFYLSRPSHLLHVSTASGPLKCFDPSEYILFSTAWPSCSP